MLFSQRDIDVLRIVCWCQYVRPEELQRITTDTDLRNLISLGLLKCHVKSGAMVLTAKGLSFLKTLSQTEPPALSQSYHEAAIRRRLRQSRIALTAYRGSVNLFIKEPKELTHSPSLFLPSISRGYHTNPWGNTRVAAIARLGDMICAMHYVCPGIGKLALIDELAVFSNQTARFRDTKRAFIFAGESYADILTELESSISEADSKLITYGDACHGSQLPVHLLSCDDTGAVQLQIMAAPDYRRRLTKAALKVQYQPPPNQIWDALFQGIPFVMAADMDLRRIDTAISAARQEGIQQIAIASLEGQAQEVLFPRYRDTGMARVFILTSEAISEVTGRPPVPHVPPRTQFLTEKGEVVDAPPIQVHRKAGGPCRAEVRSLV